MEHEGFDVLFCDDSNMPIGKPTLTEEELRREEKFIARLREELFGKKTHIKNPAPYRRHQVGRASTLLV